LPASHPDYPLALFHSHPFGPAELSAVDLATAWLRIDHNTIVPSYTQQHWLIVGPHWRIMRFVLDATVATTYRQLSDQP
jgi:proteasome lid subunit RPN8/RPN11